MAAVVVAAALVVVVVVAAAAAAAVTAAMSAVVAAAAASADAAAPMYQAPRGLFAICGITSPPRSGRKQLRPDLGGLFCVKWNRFFVPTLYLHD